MTPTMEEILFWGSSRIMKILLTCKFSDTRCQEVFFICSGKHLTSLEYHVCTKSTRLWNCMWTWFFKCNLFFRYTCGILWVVCDHKCEVYKSIQTLLQMYPPLMAQAHTAWVHGRAKNGKLWGRHTWSPGPLAKSPALDWSDGTAFSGVMELCAILLGEHYPALVPVLTNVRKIFTAAKGGKLPFDALDFRGNEWGADSSTCWM